MRGCAPSSGACALGSPADWERMIAHLAAAREATGRPCRIFMDLTGPKLRTGPMTPGPRVLALHPLRNLRGVPLRPAPVRLVPESSPCTATPDTAEPVLPVSEGLFRRLRAGGRITFADARGRPGSLEVLSVDAGEARAVSPESAYLEAGMRLVLEPHEGVPAAEGTVGALPALENALVLRTGDTLLIHGDPRPGEPASGGPGGGPARPAHIACAVPEVLQQVQPGEPVFLDDGRAEGVVRAVRPEEIEVEIVRAPPEGMRLRGGKGLNFPGSRLSISGLTDQDREDLRFVAAHADGVGLSFVNGPDDVEALTEALDAVGGGHLGVVLKIENRRGVEELPRILRGVENRTAVGVMIARGDLAVEGGWVALAAYQEQILRACAAAHVPAIWATGVLDRLAKRGIPTRAEITDAAAGARAACVMLNKGRYIVDAVRTLDAILVSGAATAG